MSQGQSSVGPVVRALELEVGQEGDLAAAGAASAEAGGQPHCSLGGGADGLGQGVGEVDSREPPPESASRVSSVRVWAGSCFHCHGALKVTVTRLADGREKCVVVPYDHTMGRARSRSKSRSPTPALSPVRTVGQRDDLSEVDTLIDGQDSPHAGEERDILPDGQDTRLLELFSTP